jgi:ribosomal protein S18 acetylase RimI-like enzyme
VSVRRAVPADLEAIAAIQEASPEASQWSPADYLSYECLVSADPPQAFIVTRCVAPGEYEILNLAVAPSARRGGMARGLLEHVLDASPGSWFLEVRASNRAAIRLYESTGFRRLGSRPGYYQESSEEAIVMHLQK